MAISKAQKIQALANRIEGSIKVCAKSIEVLNIEGENILNYSSGYASKIATGNNQLLTEYYLRNLETPLYEQVAELIEKIKL
tara:strand:- start:1040 stop:1285 length:246 start_codon:yes stop_codon:yes gene_type:complete